MKKLKFLLLFLYFLCFISCEKNKAIDINAKLFQNKIYKNKNKELKIKFLDSINSISNQTKNDSVFRNFLFDLSSEYYYLNENKKSLNVGKKILQLSNIAKDTFSKARANSYIGDTYYFTQMDSAYFYHQKAENIYRSINNEERVATEQYKKAYILYLEGNYTESESQVSEALLYFKNGKDSEMLHSSYNLMGLNSEKLDDNQAALNYQLQAKDIITAIKGYNSDLEKRYLYGIESTINIAYIYEKMLQYDKSEKELQSILTPKLKQKFLNGYVTALGNINYCKMKLGKLTNVEENFKTALSIAEKNDFKNNIVYQHKNLGEYYSIVKDTNRSIAYLKKSLSLAEKIKAGEEIKVALKMLSIVDYRNASKYDRRYIFITDSLSKAQRINRNKYARIEYETSVVEDQNKLLSAKNTYILIGAFALTLVFILIIAYRYVKNQKREKTFIAQQQKAEEEIFELLKSHQIKLNEVKITEQNRISFELHDGILNKLYSIRFQLGILNESDGEEVIAKRENYLDMLQKLEEEIRDISHKLQTDLIDAQFEYSSLLRNLILEKNELKISTFKINIDKHIEWENVSGLVKITIYRIVQEALHNVVKYAGAEYCVVSINSGVNNTLDLTIADDGKGFEVATVENDGIGLKNMQERAKSIQAKFSISSVIGEGTKIQVVFENSGSKKE